MSLYNIRKKENAFYDKQDSHHLSKSEKHFIAGILHYIQEITLTLNPTVNSYYTKIKHRELEAFNTAVTDWEKEQYL